MSYNKRTVGTNNEDKAINFMQELGYQLLDRNYRCPFGEIDAIFTKDKVLVVCEIKYRSNKMHGDPLEAVDYRKQKRISRSTLFYYAKKGLSMEQSCRFDVIGIYGDGSIKHVQNAFMFVR